ncbi:MAG: MurR/RpiR family transcriptional regulator [Devosia sp.]
MTAPIDIITVLRDKSDKGTPAERRLAEVILQDVAGAVRTSIAELAKSANVSEPTVTRLATGMGLEGTRELKLRLAQAVALGGAFLDSKGEAVNLGKSRAVATISTAAKRAIDELQSHLDEALLDEVARRIVASDKVMAFGTGGISSVMAQELKFRLFRFGLNVSAEIDGRIQRMTAAVATKSTVAFGFSLSGGASSVIDAISIAKQYGATTVVVAPEESPLARISEIVIPFRHVEDGQIYKPTSARFALLALVDIISLKTAEQFGPAIVENLRRMKLSLSVADNYDPTLPLGD